MSNPNIWAPGESITANESIRTQAFIASTSQSDFTLTSFSYSEGTGSLYVYVSGLMQRPGTDFIETGVNSFRLTTAVPAGTIVLAVAMVEVSAVLDQMFVVSDYYTAVGGETLVSWSNFEYTIGGNHLRVFRNGSLQEVDYGYTETSRSSVTFLTQLDAGDRITFLSNVFYTESEDGNLRGDLLSSGGSALVGFIADGAGAVPRTMQDKALEIVSVKDFGAVGVTDDTAAIQAALDAVSASGGGVVRGVGGLVYKVTGSLNIGDNTTLADIEIHSESPAGVGAIRCVNSLPSGVLLTANAVYADTTVSIATTAGIAAGDAGLISSPVLWSDDGSDQFTQGEAVIIRRVIDATIIELTTPIDSNYNVADGATFKRIPTTRKNSGLNNVKLRGIGTGGGQYGVVAANVQDFSITDDCDISGFETATVQLDGVVGASIRESKLSDARQSGLGYNILMANACRFVRITGNELLNSRAAFANGGSAGCSRDIVINGNNIAGFYTAALGMKGNVSAITVTGNTITGDASSVGLADGIRARGRDMVITGNTIKGCKRYPILCYPNGNNSAQTNKVVITGNVIEGAEDIGIYFVDEYSGVVSGAQISGNVISCENVASVPKGAINVRANNKALSNLSVFGNVIRNSPFNGIDVRTTGTGTIDNYLQYGNVISFSATGIAGSRRRSIATGTLTNTSITDGDGEWLYNPLTNVWNLKVSRTDAYSFDLVGILPVQSNERNLGASAYRFAETYSTNFRPGTGAVTWTAGPGSPEGVVTAAVGSLYTRTNGGALTTLYIKESGTGNTGWVAK